MMTNLPNEASFLAENGFLLFPIHGINDGRCTCGSRKCSSPGKHPRISSWQTEATNDTHRLNSWCQTWPGCNWAVTTGGESGLLILDVDGPEGVESLRKLEEEHDSLPATWTVKTGRGVHFYYKTEDPVRTFTGFREKLDVKSSGGYVITPPSVHASGRIYEWDPGANPETIEIAPAPEWLLEQLKQRPDISDSSIPEMISEGSRNKHLTSVAGALRRKGSTPEVILQTLLAENKTRCTPPISEEEVEKIAFSVSRYRASEKSSFEISDLNNAERFAALHHKTLKYCSPWKKWLCWNGMKWEIGNDSAVYSLVKDVIQSILSEAEQVTDSKSRSALLKQAKQLKSKNRINAILALAKLEPTLQVKPEELDENPWLLNCHNVIVDLRSGKAIAHDPAYLMTKNTNVSFDPAAQCPNWIEFLHEIMLGDKEMVNFLQRAAGYSMTGNTDERCMLILHGSGRNGKSTFLDVLATLASEYGSRAPVDTLIAHKQTGGINNDLAKISGSRFVHASESEENRQLAEARIKEMTGQDVLTARFLFSEFFDFIPRFKIWLATNHRPRIKGTDDAIWDRIRLVPFDFRVPDDKKIASSELKGKLLAEASGILNWIIDGCLQWQSQGLKPPLKIQQANFEYREEQDVLSAFLNECMETKPGLKVQISVVFDCYANWCQRNGEEPIKSRHFGNQLRLRNYDVRPGNGNKTFVFDIGLVGRHDEETNSAVEFTAMTDDDFESLFDEKKC